MTLIESHKIDSNSWLAKHFMRHQIAWITAEEAIHKQKKRAIALAEKSVRIGWTFAADFFALRKSYANTRWAFSEAQNTVNPVSHCDIAWAAGLATHAHLVHHHEAGAMVG